ncbi:FAD-dependent oxidoreductase [Salipiger aestuarii]|uniref:3-(3-hydroxy-phenyl)propionate hydroxylase n=1 Tax=Salipiger aestuarii TaxID=568098 RepID=A0A327Y0W2_9RHOB|nr:FAD-dependent monooxygenase [Salipiger aestuarii]EIE51302.1 FAD-dependent oxidoreductase [Citreicella sp. 357]KAA8607832.1 FAD-dependent oxidoreductase [Salipiger aestuarii]KAB2541088.1 FAD-dependent oxidoreductase [Salipiger aestuarii]RAK13335.1 3-(3-hydroxy-phenyl)propionate hydroxylase [Salipiger aestuarii]
MPAYSYDPQPFVRPPELDGGSTGAPVAIVGAGPIGLAMAVDLALQGVRCVVLDDNNVVSVGSRAICWAKRTLEIFDRLGVADRMLAKGVTWKVGRLFHGADEVYSFDLLPEDGHKFPAFINLQQYYVEQYLLERARDFPDLIDLRFLSRVTGHRATDTGVALEVDTPEGAYTLHADWLLACDGAGSQTRARMGLDFAGQTFAEQFLIADIELAESPFDQGTPERWFWFDPEFHPGKSALLHMQPDNLYRIDLQLDQGADAEQEATEEKVTPRIRAIVGDRPFRLDWLSVYTFRCIKLDRFVHGRVVFVGDSAHVVSPFGARGGNGGIQDVDNLGWKLAAVIRGDADTVLLESYHEERSRGSAENIRNSTRATNFMTPKTPVEAMFRRETLRLAHTHPFARQLINSGRLSLPCALDGLSLQTPGPGVGLAMVDAPLGDGWLLPLVQGRFALVGFGDIALPDIGLPRVGIGGPARGYECHDDPQGYALQRYGTGVAHLVRPDGHVAATFTGVVDAHAARTALARAMGKRCERVSA